MLYEWNAACLWFACSSKRHAQRQHCSAKRLAQRRQRRRPRCVTIGRCCTLEVACCLCVYCLQLEAARSSAATAAAEMASVQARLGDLELEHAAIINKPPHLHDALDPTVPDHGYRAADTEPRHAHQSTPTEHAPFSHHSGIVQTLRHHLHTVERAVSMDAVRTVATLPSGPLLPCCAVPTGLARPSRSATPCRAVWPCAIQCGGHSNLGWKQRSCDRA